MRLSTNDIQNSSICGSDRPDLQIMDLAQIIGCCVRRSIFVEVPTFEGSTTPTIACTADAIDSVQIRNVKHAFKQSSNSSCEYN